MSRESDIRAGGAFVELYLKGGQVVEQGLEQVADRTRSFSQAITTAATVSNITSGHIATSIRAASQTVSQVVDKTARAAQVAVNATAGAISKTIDSIPKAVDRAGRALDQLGQRSILGGLLSGSAAASSMRQFMEFERQMSRVKALTGETGVLFDQMTEQARELGRTTQYTATQVAEGMAYLAMAGMKAEDAIAMIPTVLDLATASMMDLGQTADIVTDIGLAFGYTGDRVVHVADVLAKAASSSNTTVEMMGMSFKYLASFAVAAGQSIEDMATALALLAQVGIKKNTAGTGLREALTNLVTPPKREKLRMELGVEIADPSGQIKPILDIIGEIRQALSRLPQDAQLEVMTQIFGKRGGNVMLALTHQSADALDEMRQKMHNADGAVAQMAQTMRGNLWGGWKAFISIIQDVQIEIGKALTPAVRGLLDILVKAGTSVGKFIAANTGLVNGIALLVPASLAAGAALTAIGKSMQVLSRVSSPVFGALSKTVSGFGTAVYGALESVRLLVSGGLLVSGAFGTLTALFQSLIGTMSMASITMTSLMTGLAVSVLVPIKAVQGLWSAINFLSGQFRAAGDVVAGFFSSAAAGAPAVVQIGAAAAETAAAVAEVGAAAAEGGAEVVDAAANTANALSEMVRSMVSAGATTAEVARTLSALGVSSSEVAVMLASTASGAADAAAIMIEAGASISSFAETIAKSVSSAAELQEVLTQTAANASTAAATFIQFGSSAAETANAMSSMGFSAAEIAEGLTYAGVAAAETASVISSTLLGNAFAAMGDVSRTVLQGASDMMALSDAAVMFERTGSAAAETFAEIGAEAAILGSRIAGMSGGLFEGLVDSGETLSEVLSGGTRTAAQFTAETARLSAAFTRVGADATASFADMGRALADMGSSASSIVGDIASFGSGVAGIAAGDLEFLNDVARSAADSFARVSAAVTAVGSGIAETAAIGLDGLIDGSLTLEQVLGDVASSASGAASNVTRMTSDLAESLTVAAASVAPVSADMARQLTEMAGAVSSAGSNMAEGIMDAAADASASLSDIGRAAADLGSDIARGTSNSLSALTNIADSATNTFANIENVVAQAGREIAVTASLGFEGLVRGGMTLEEVLGNVARTGADAAANVTMMTEQLAANLAQAATEVAPLSAAMARQLTEMAASVTASGEQMAAGLTRAAADAASSLSSVFDEVVELAAEGGLESASALANGLLRMSEMMAPFSQSVSEVFLDMAVAAERGLLDVSTVASRITSEMARAAADIAGSGASAAAAGATAAAETAAEMAARVVALANAALNEAAQGLANAARASAVEVMRMVNSLSGAMHTAGLQFMQQLSQFVTVLSDGTATISRAGFDTLVTMFREAGASMSQAKRQAEGLLSVIGDMMRGMSSAQLEVFFEAIRAGAHDVEAASNALASFGSEAASVGTTLAGTVARACLRASLSIATLAAPLVLAAAAFWVVYAFAKAAFFGIITAAQKLAAGVWEAMKGIGGGLKTALGQTIAGIGNALKILSSDLSKWWGESAKSITRTGEVLKARFGEVYESYQAIVNAMQSGEMEAAMKIAYNEGLLLMDDLEEAARQILSQILIAAPGIIASLSDALGAVFSGIADGFITLWETLKAEFNVMIIDIQRIFLEMIRKIYASGILGETFKQMFGDVELTIRETTIKKRIAERERYATVVSRSGLDEEAQKRVMRVYDRDNPIDADPKFLKEYEEKSKRDYKLMTSLNLVRDPKLMNEHKELQKWINANRAEYQRQSKGRAVNELIPERRKKADAALKNELNAAGLDGGMFDGVKEVLGEAGKAIGDQLEKTALAPNKALGLVTGGKTRQEVEDENKALKKEALALDPKTHKVQREQDKSQRQIRAEKAKSTLLIKIEENKKTGIDTTKTEQTLKEVEQVIEAEKQLWLNRERINDMQRQVKTDESKKKELLEAGVQPDDDLIKALDMDIKRLKDEINALIKSLRPSGNPNLPNFKSSTPDDIQKTKEWKNRKQQNQQQQQNSPPSGGNNSGQQQQNSNQKEEEKKEQLKKRRAAMIAKGEKNISEALLEFEIEANDLSAKFHHLSNKINRSDGSDYEQLRKEYDSLNEKVIAYHDRWMDQVEKATGFRKEDFRSDPIVLEKTSSKLKKDSPKLRQFIESGLGIVNTHDTRSKLRDLQNDLQPAKHAPKTLSEAIAIAPEFAEFNQLRTAYAAQTSGLKTSELREMDFKLADEMVAAFDKGVKAIGRADFGTGTDLFGNGDYWRQQAAKAKKAETEAAKADAKAYSQRMKEFHEKNPTVPPLEEPSESPMEIETPEVLIDQADLMMPPKVDAPEDTAEPPVTLPEIETPEIETPEVPQAEKQETALRNLTKNTVAAFANGAEDIDAKIDEINGVDSKDLAEAVSSPVLSRDYYKNLENFIAGFGTYSAYDIMRGGKTDNKDKVLDELKKHTQSLNRISANINTMN